MSVPYRTTLARIPDYLLAVVVSSIYIFEYEARDLPLPLSELLQYGVFSTLPGQERKVLRTHSPT